MKNFTITIGLIEGGFHVSRKRAVNVVSIGENQASITRPYVIDGDAAHSIAIGFKAGHVSIGISEAGFH